MLYTLVIEKDAAKMNSSSFLSQKRCQATLANDNNWYEETKKLEKQSS